MAFTLFYPKTITSSIINEYVFVKATTTLKRFLLNKIFLFQDFPHRFRVLKLLYDIRALQKDKSALPWSASIYLLADLEWEKSNINGKNNDTHPFGSLMKRIL